MEVAAVVVYYLFAGFGLVESRRRTSIPTPTVMDLSNNTNLSISVDETRRRHDVLKSSIILLEGLGKARMELFWLLLC